MTKTWDDNADWDPAQSRTLVHAAQPSNTDWTDPGTIEIGYPTTDQNGSALEAYYPMAESSGGTMYDVAGSQNGSYTAPNHAQSGVLGRNAVGLPTGNNGVARSASGLDCNGSTFSVGMWFKFPSSSAHDTDAVILAAGTSITDASDTISDGWELRFSGDTETLEVANYSGGTESGSVTGPTLSAGTFYYCTVRGNGDTVTLDTVDESGTQTTNSVTAARGTGTATMVVTSGNGSKNTDGHACHLRAWSRELADSELSTLALQDSPTASITTTVK